jgi:hypothetical protein
VYVYVLEVKRHSIPISRHLQQSYWQSHQNSLGESKRRHDRGHGKDFWDEL